MAERAHPAVRLREAWRAGKPTFGAWLSLDTTHSAEVFGRAGFDWVGIDLQHGRAHASSLPEMLQALAITDTPSLVRVAWNSPDQIMHALDAGAHVVIVPNVGSADEAAQAGAACRYPPRGIRSWGPTRPSLTEQGYDAESADESVICAVMVESREAVDAAGEIARAPNVDAVVVGPRDLALSLGHRGRVERDALDEALAAVLESCARANIVPGIFAGGAKAGLRYADQGFRLVALASDAALLAQGAAEMAAAVGATSSEAAVAY
jgi:4-hydroxy-2-oxoheptanedioate aldolase